MRSFIDLKRPFAYPPRTKDIYQTLRDFYYSGFQRALQPKISELSLLRITSNPWFPLILLRLNQENGSYEAHDTPNFNLYPMTIDRHLQPQSVVVKDNFWVMVEENRTQAQVSFEQSSDSSSESAFSKCKTPFMDQQEGEGILINPRSILRIRLERVEVHWTEVRF